MQKMIRTAAVTAASLFLVQGLSMTAWADAVSLRSSSEIATGQNDSFTTDTVNGKTVQVWEIEESDTLTLEELDLPHLNYCELSVGILYPQPDKTYKIDTIHGDEEDYVGGAGAYLVLDTDLNVGDEYPLYDTLEKEAELGGHKMSECLFFLMFRYDKGGEETVWTGDIYVKFVHTQTTAQPGTKTESELEAEAAAKAAQTPHWASNNTGWWIEYGDGSYLTDRWYQGTAGKWYYLGADGYMLTNAWKQSNGKWYYLGADGSMRTDCWQQGADGLWYRLDSDGGMLTNVWYRAADGRQYYLGANGAMVTAAWQQEPDGNWYYLGADGVMLTDTVTPDGYTVGADGALV